MRRAAVLAIAMFSTIAACGDDGVGQSGTTSSTPSSRLLFLDGHHRWDNDLTADHGPDDNKGEHIGCNDIDHSGGG